MSLNTATVKTQWNLREAVEGCSRFGIAGIAPWRDKLKECGVKEASTMISDHGLRVTGLCRGGMFTTEEGISDSILDDNKHAVDEAYAIGAECLVMVVGGLKPDSKDLIGARLQVEEGLFKCLEHARTSGVKIAVEPLHPMYASDRSCINTICQALDICDQLGDGIGVAIDVYHVWWDPDLESQLKRTGKNRLMAFHICDWLMDTKDLLLDRGMMGDGVINIPKIRSWIEREGYEGLNEVEIFSENNWWKKNPNEVLRTSIERLKDC